MPMTMPQGLTIPSLVDDMKRLLKTSARMYMSLARATLDQYGRAGELPVRYGLRAYGAWRGLEMREAHHAMGLDINMKNLILCWDNASTYIVKDAMDEGATYRPNDTRFDVHLCPAAQAWKEAEFHQWGHAYCDEFHQACASSYHPDGNVVIPINLMKGDDHCHFQWIMPPEAQKLDLGEPTELGRRLARDYEANSDIEAAWKSLKRSNRLVGGRYATAARVLVEQFGSDGEDTIRAAMRAWGALRGDILRREHLAKGLPVDLVSFLHHHDFPYPTVWEVHEHVATARKVVVEIGATPQDEVWQDLGAGALAAHWYRESYPAMAEAYLPGSRARWPRLACLGDSASELQIEVQ